MAIHLSERPNGVNLYQVTTDKLDKSNIYCELPYCDAHSRRFVYQQQHPDTVLNRTEYVACEFGTWKTEVIGRGLGGPGMTHKGIFFYHRIVAGKCQELVRYDLNSGSKSVLFELPENHTSRGLGTMSPDERYYAYGVTLGYSPQLFGIELIDLHKGTREVIHTDPDICNPHTQFEPTHGRCVMVQHNRGCEFQADGTRIKLVGEAGATEYLVSVPEGEVTRLQVGPPHTPGITGHEAWIAGRNEILMSVRPVDRYIPEKGNLIRIGPGKPPERVGAPGYRFNHVGTSPCGNYYFCDDWRGACKLVVGNIHTGKTAEVCEAHTSMGQAQNTHAHPYLSPDLKWLVFNSDRTVRPQIHVASVPEALIASLN
jgi:hypothetical protein